MADRAGLVCALSSGDMEGSKLAVGPEGEDTSGDRGRWEDSGRDWARSPSSLPTLPTREKRTPVEDGASAGTDDRPVSPPAELPMSSLPRLRPRAMTGWGPVSMGDAGSPSRGERPNEMLDCDRRVNPIATGAGSALGFAAVGSTAVPKLMARMRVPARTMLRFTFSRRSLDSMLSLTSSDSKSRSRSVSLSANTVAVLAMVAIISRALALSAAGVVPAAAPLSTGPRLLPGPVETLPGGDTVPEPRGA